MTCDSPIPAFRSILWHDATAANAAHDDVAVPACFHDLNLDQIVDAVTAAWPDENLAAFFRAPLHDTAAIACRQTVFRDLDQAPMRQSLAAFVERMRAARVRLADVGKSYYAREKQRAHLDAAAVYGEAAQTLALDLERLRPASPGLRALQACLNRYVGSDPFRKLTDDTRTCLSGLATVRYGLLIQSGSVTVRPYAGEADASVDVEETFAKFRRDAASDYRMRSRGRIGVNGINHVEAQILDRIALLHPQTFAALDAFCTTHAEFIDPMLARLAREICFYLAWLAYTDPLRAAGLPFCLPAVERDSETVAVEAAVDIALASKRIAEHKAVVRNGFALHTGERILVVTGPNHGGKTTFARMFGQLHWLAALGCTVPGTHARLGLFDQLFTHFEKQETIETLHGKLQDDLIRVHAILDAATPRSLIVLNEIFASTTLEDALWLGRRIMARIAALDARAVCVTFLTELASFDSKTVSMVAEVAPHDPAVRTFALVRRPADGLSHALAIAHKHGVTREQLLQRIVR